MRVSRTILLLFFLLIMVHSTRATASLDFMVRGVGLSLGNSPRVVGIRINAVDSDVRRVDGLNITLWNPRPSPRADFNGLALGLIGPKGGRIHGIALGGIGATAADRIRGLAIGGFGAGTKRLTGVALGGILTEIQGDSRGGLASVVICRAHSRMDGLALAGGFVNADSIRGVAVGGLFVFGKNMRGLALSGGLSGFDGDVRGLCAGGILAGGSDLSGVAVGGLGAMASVRLRGIALSAGVAGAGKKLDGIAAGGLGVGAGDALRGLALGGLVSMAPEVTGVSLGALNGVIVKSVNLEDFLEIRTVNQRYTGLSLGLVNYSAELHGAQIGLFNYAANNPKWARLLPIVNFHL
jgi:hypothetical protein